MNEFRAYEEIHEQTPVEHVAPLPPIDKYVPSPTSSSRYCYVS
jgi:hypothetical protein